MKSRFDPEICVMNQLLKLMLELDRPSQIRVLDWAKQRAVDDKYYEPIAEEDDVNPEEDTTVE